MKVSQLKALGKPGSTLVYEEKEAGYWVLPSTTQSVSENTLCR